MKPLKGEVKIKDFCSKAADISESAGVSKTFAKNMLRNGISTPHTYRKHRTARKKAVA